MHKRYTRAQKRQIVQQLFQRRNSYYMFKYLGQKKKECITEWQKTQSDLMNWILDSVDEGVKEEIFYEHLKAHGWTIDPEIVEKDGLLVDYIEALEELYPDTAHEEETVLELGSELNELKKEKV